MLKMLITLARGQARSRAEDFADRNALLILDQQVRDATQALERAKRGLALAMANDQRERKRLETINQQIADMEARVIAAMSANAEAAAREGAEAIAALEADRDATATASTLFTQEISRLRQHVSQAERRILEVDRGRRIARASESVRSLRKGRMEEASCYQATLSDAEITLKRLRDRQIEEQAAEDMLDQIDSATSPITIAEKLAEQGFGPRLKTTADDVLSCLKSKTAA